MFVLLSAIWISYTPWEAPRGFVAIYAAGILDAVTSCTHAVPFHRYAPFVSVRATIVPSGAISMPLTKPPEPTFRVCQLVEVVGSTTVVPPLPSLESFQVDDR